VNAPGCRGRRDFHGAMEPLNRLLAARRSYSPMVAGVFKLVRQYSGMSFQYRRMTRFAISPVQPVWWAAPKPWPVSPSKYS
jgi:hypothetical protein